MRSETTLLDLPPYPPGGYAALADRLARLLGTSGDVLWVQGEAILALEALAASLARPGLRAVNVVTSPYGALFGRWLRRGGAAVRDVMAETGRPVRTEAVAEALGAGADLVAMVHAESASGICNPLEAVAALARQAGAMIAVDAVASLGGHPVEVDALGLDAVVVGPQKALGGPAGVSAVVLGARAWEAVDRADAPRDSALSLVDLRRNWLQAGRGALPGMPSAIEWWALDAALTRVEAEGLPAVVARHQRARRAARAALGVLGLPLWVAREEEASALVTAAVLERPLDFGAGSAALRAVADPAIGSFDRPVIRFNHTGARSRPLAMAEGIVALADALRVPSQRIDHALDAAGAA